VRRNVSPFQGFNAGVTCSHGFKPMATCCRS